MKSQPGKRGRPQQPTLEERLSHALLVHEDTMRVVRGEKSEYSYTPTERRNARKLILKCGADKPQVIQ